MQHLFVLEVRYSSSNTTFVAEMSSLAVVVLTLSYSRHYVDVETGPESVCMWIFA